MLTITIGYALIMTTLTIILIISLVAEVTLEVLSPVKGQPKEYAYTPVYA